jgi:MFS family permease
MNGRFNIYSTKNIKSLFLVPLRASMSNSSLAPTCQRRQAPLPLPDTHYSRERVLLAALFFMLGHALALWSINFSGVLEAYGYRSIISYAWATNATAAIISPLIVGALADQCYSSERVLRWLGFGSAILLCLLSLAIDSHQANWAVLALAQCHALFSVPSFGLATSLVISRLHEPKREFGPLRSFATVGWMVGGVILSLGTLFQGWLLRAGMLESGLLVAVSRWWKEAVEGQHFALMSGIAGALSWLAVITITWGIRPVPPLGELRHRTWRDILGLEAWSLLRHPDHRVVFVGAALFNVPLAAFYQETPLHLHDIGLTRLEVPAAMSLGQVMEVVGLFSLAWLLARVRLKWLFLSGIAFGALRYGLFIFNTLPAICSGIFMHGLCFTLFFMSAQIYLEQRIAPAMRARAQALLSLMMSGIGNLFGYLLCGAWRTYCTQAETTDWPRYWLGLTLVIVAIMAWFAASYRGKYRGEW